MSRLYTILASNIFALFYLKCIVSTWPTILLITRGYGFIESNLGRHNHTKLTNNQATQILKRPQCGPIFTEVQDNLSFNIIFHYGPKSKLQSIIDSFYFQHDGQLKVKLLLHYKLISMLCNN